WLDLSAHPSRGWSEKNHRDWRSFPPGSGSCVPGSSALLACHPDCRGRCNPAAAQGIEREWLDCPAARLPPFIKRLGSEDFSPPSRLCCLDVLVWIAVVQVGIHVVGHLIGRAADPQQQYLAFIALQRTG